MQSSLGSGVDKTVRVSPVVREYRYRQDSLPSQLDTRLVL